MTGGSPVGFDILSYYQLYELNHASLSPLRAAADATRLYFQNPLNPISHTPWGGTSRRPPNCSSAPPANTANRLSATKTTVDWENVAVHREDRLVAAFLQSDPLREARAARPGAGQTEAADRGADVGPLCDVAARHGRDHAAAADVYITDWADARMVPLAEGSFDLDDYIDYLIDDAARARRRTRMSWRSASPRCRCWRRRH